jgi:hypothetical protein
LCVLDIVLFKTPSSPTGQKKLRAVSCAAETKHGCMVITVTDEETEDRKDEVTGPQPVLDGSRTLSSLSPSPSPHVIHSKQESKSKQNECRGSR